MITFVIISIFSLIVSLVTSIYTIVQNGEIHTIGIEDQERNEAEIIWFWICISIISLYIIALIAVFTYIYYNKITDLPKETIIKWNTFSLLILCIITTSLSWDFFSRNASKNTERDTYMALTVLEIFTFLRILDFF